MNDRRLSVSVRVMSLLLALLVTSASGCSGGPKSASRIEDPKVKLRFAFELPAEHPWGKGAEEFKKIVESKTNGTITVDLYPAGQLASSGRDVQENVKMGSIDMGISSTPIVLLNPIQQVFDLPYIFRDKEHAWKVLDGPIGDKVGGYLAKESLKVLAFWEDGVRHITTSAKPITHPGDMIGLKMRVPESPLRIATFKAFGASPTPMPFSEVFTALQQRVIDGQENPLSVVWNSSFFDVQKYLSLTRHVYSPATLIMNLDKWGNLTDDQKKVVLEAARAGRDLNRQLNVKADSELVERLKDKGMIVNEVQDVKAFQDAAAPVWNNLVQTLGQEAKDLIDQINAVK